MTTTTTTRTTPAPAPLHLNINPKRIDTAMRGLAAWGAMFNDTDLFSVHAGPIVQNHMRLLLEAIVKTLQDGLEYDKIRAYVEQADKAAHGGKAPWSIFYEDPAYAAPEETNREGEDSADEEAVKEIPF